MKHVPSLDGVRGLCILAVMLSHYGFFSSGGWFGVEIFFVLSGFLITSILVEKRQDSLSHYLLVFYARKSLRIFPVYFLSLFLLTCVYLASARLLPQFGADWPELLTYTYNWRIALRQGRQITLLMPAAYTHFWSLCVEEQFYFGWPLFVYYLRRDHLQKLAVSLVILVPVFRYALGRWLLPTSGGLATGAIIYILTFSHLDAFMCGALLSLCPMPRHRSGTMCLIATGVVAGSGLVNSWLLPQLSPSEGRLMGHSSFGFNPVAISTAQHVWGYTVISLFGVCMIWWAVEREPALLRFAPLVHLGKVSYGAYIFHLPVLLLFSRFEKRNVLAAVLLLPVYVGVVWSIAACSFYSFEKRFLDLKDLLARSPSDKSMAPPDPVDIAAMNVTQSQF